MRWLPKRGKTEYPLSFWNYFKKSNQTSRKMFCCLKHWGCIGLDVIPQLSLKGTDFLSRFYFSRELTWWQRLCHTAFIRCHCTVMHFCSFRPNTQLTLCFQRDSVLSNPQHGSCTPEHSPVAFVSLADLVLLGENKRHFALLLYFVVWMRQMKQSLGVLCNGAQCSKGSQPCLCLWLSPYLNLSTHWWQSSGERAALMGKTA